MDYTKKKATSNSFLEIFNSCPQPSKGDNFRIKSCFPKIHSGHNCVLDDIFSLTSFVRTICKVRQSKVWSVKVGYEDQTQTDLQLH